MKYEITNISHPKYSWLHRIRALKNIENVCMKGDLGGYVQSADNLSQEGNCWIEVHAICCEQAHVGEDAVLHDGALVRESALVSGDSQLFDMALAEGYCVIKSGEIKEDARVAGYAVIGKNHTTGQSPLLQRSCNVYGEVNGWFIISENVLPGEKLQNPTQDLFVLEDGKRAVLVKQKKLENPEKNDNGKQKRNREER
ncbi:LbetaH domain-containing protein [Hespellia stercorisuis]|uniref:Uncharacterized protein n=1 Tax=Hespellia stercorisuis DSM 15480 TaxID=1121950 RepID=A0A1M6TAS2_9FIRM|nr:hypothetical protein [Hespellia stercorisuis]SHK53969.1 hypothetical protein SAMN02745243_03171 [Hespellia stercorisuis DSM 15480]